VGLQEVIGEKIAVLKLKVAKEDSGKVIGKQGKKDRTMCTILNATALKLKKTGCAGNYRLIWIGFLLADLLVPMV
jgi:predicted RNA-binding protein YlqC (UPF0109 family)